MVCKVTLGNLHTNTTISLKGGFQRLFHNPYELPSLFSSALSFLPLPSARTPSEGRGGGGGEVTKPHQRGTHRRPKTAETHPRHFRSPGRGHKMAPPRRAHAHAIDFR